MNKPKSISWEMALNLFLAFFILFPFIYLLLNRETKSENSQAEMNNGELQQSQKLDSLKNQTLIYPTCENLIALGLEYFNIKQYHESIMANEKALEINPKSATAFNNMGVSYNCLKLWDKGIECCQKALFLQPDFQLAKNNLNWAMEEKKKMK